MPWETMSRGANREFRKRYMRIQEDLTTLPAELERFVGGEAKDIASQPQPTLTLLQRQGEDINALLKQNIVPSQIYGELLKVLRDMQEPFHVHGFRSSFTDWAANEGFPNAVVEAALAHKTPDAVQAAYRRTTYLGTPDNPGARVKLMEAWGDYCSGVAAA